MRLTNLTCASFFFATLFLACKTDTAPETSFQANFDQTHDRIWPGEDFWTIPLEEWRVQDGRLECTGTLANMRANIITRGLSGEGDLKLSATIGVLKKNGEVGSTAGFPNRHPG